MCGIFGSTNFKNYEKMYVANRERGSFSYGSLYTTKSKEIYVRKDPGVVELTGDYAFSSDYKNFLGHTQAPTSSARKFSPTTSHPFEDFYYIVAHNGVLENDQQIIDDYLPGHANPVDSSVIPALISVVFDFSEDFLDDDVQDEYNERTAEIVALETAFGKLKGTFACWVYSKLTGCTFICRSGSTLFGNIDTGEFSSIKIPGIAEQELAEGVIYCCTTEGIATCGKFEKQSPFFL